MASRAIVQIHSGRMTSGPGRLKRYADVRIPERRFRRASASVAVALDADSPFIGELRVLPLDIAPRGVKDAFRVAGDDDLRIQAIGHEQSIGGDICGADAEQHDAYLVEGFADHLQSGEQTRKGDRRRALLIVMPDRNGDPPTRLVEHSKALRLRNVFEMSIPPNDGSISSTARTISAASRARMQSGVASTPPRQLEEEGLAFHDRQACLGTDVAEAEHARAVRNDGDGVAPIGVGEHRFRVGRDRSAGLGDPRSVPNREVSQVANRNLGLGLDLAAIARMHRQRAIGQGVDCLRDLVRFLHG